GFAIARRHFFAREAHPAVLDPDVVNRVLDDVEARRVPEQPAREDPVPLGVGIGIAPFLHDDLDEGARLGRLLPRGGALAGRKAHDDVADTALFSGPELDLARDVVA